jgi:hypothetical protein
MSMSELSHKPRTISALGTLNRDRMAYLLAPEFMGAAAVTFIGESGVSDEALGPVNGRFRTAL